MWLWVFSCSIPWESAWLAMISTKGEILASRTVLSTCHPRYPGQEAVWSWQNSQNSLMRRSSLWARCCQIFHECLALLHLLLLVHTHWALQAGYSALVLPSPPRAHHSINHFSCNWWEWFWVRMHKQPAESSWLLYTRVFSRVGEIKQLKLQMLMKTLITHRKH